MGQLLFFAIIILLSIAESVARSRKAKARRESGQAAEPERFEWAQTPPWEAELPTYDAEPSYDDDASRESSRSPADPRTARREAPPPSRPGKAAEDIWAEIAGLATGEQERARGEPRPAPRTSPPLPAPAPPVEPARRPASYVEEARARLAAERASVTPAPSHKVHLSHAGYGTDPSERAASEQDGLDPLAGHLGANAAAARGQLRGGAAALRRAIIVREVLDLPVALRK